MNVTSAYFSLLVLQCAEKYRKLGEKVLFNFSCDKTNETVCYKPNFIV